MRDTITCPNCHTVYRRADAPNRAGGWDVPYKQHTMNRMNFGGGRARAVKQSVRTIPVSHAATR